MVEISASMLSSDFSCLAQEINALEKAGVHRFHWDMMDGSYVPNLTFGPPLLQKVRELTPLPFDVHLMVYEVETLIPLCVTSGADSISFHPEAVAHPYRLLQHIQTHHKKRGIAINPGTSLSSVEALLPLCDFILMMTVNPGFGGQKFLPDQLEKIRQVNQWCQKKNHLIPIHVDGGMSPQTAPLAKDAGGTVFIAGSSLFNASVSYESSVGQLLSSLAEEI